MAKDFLLTKVIDNRTLNIHRYYVYIGNPAHTFKDNNFRYVKVPGFGFEHNSVTRAISSLPEDPLLTGFGMLAGLTSVEKFEDAEGFISNDYDSLLKAIRMAKPKHSNGVTFILDSHENLFNNNQPKDTLENRLNTECNRKQNSLPIYWDYYDNENIVVHRWWQPTENNYADIKLKHAHRAIVSAYRKVTDGIAEWLSNIYPNMHRDSYRELISRNDDYPNSIANLYQDYHEKGTGLSALIHCHLFRHKENIQMAKVIEKQLRNNYSGADKLTIAEYLVSQLTLLEQNGYEVSTEGSFYRRTCYAILQLTEGLCASPQEFEQYYQQVRTASLSCK